MGMADLSGIWALTLAAFVLGRLAEWRVHRRNYAALRAMGALELAPWLMRGYYAVTALVVPAAVVEQILTAGTPTRLAIVLGSAACGAAIFLRFWAIRSLGGVWTMRCLALPGLRHANVGPYRLLSNPEYFSRLIEGAGVCLLLRAELSLAVYVTVTAAYGVYLSGLEKKQLDAVQDDKVRSAP